MPDVPPIGPPPPVGKAKEEPADGRSAAEKPADGGSSARDQSELEGLFTPSTGRQRDETIADPTTVSSEPATTGRARTTRKRRPTKSEARQLNPASRLTRVTSSAQQPPSTTNVRLLPGRLVPGSRYRIVRWLGEGGMGVVYEAEHVDIDRRVALKILRVDASLDPTLAQRFRDEARSASRIGSEHIVEIYDFGELPDGRLMFAMELLHGHSLVEELDNCPIDSARLIAILRQACKGLVAAHAAGIVHRDIKPENILLTEKEGRQDHIRIVDFGVARILSGPDDQETTAAGTPHYMAPEQCTGMPYDGRLDMYALACTAYELLVGDPPFMEQDVEAILHAHLDQEAVPPSQTESKVDIHPALEAVLLRCLAKRKEDRFADMNDLEAALCEAQIEAGIETAWDDLPLPEVEPDRRERLLRDMPSPEDAVGADRQRRWMWPSVAAVSLLTAGVLGFTLLSAPDPTDSEATEVDNLTNAARAAAARAYWVYPPVSEPEGDTAYRKVRSLEKVEGAAAEVAEERATALREEFATTLIRLGDRYWDREGGRAFSSDYYAQALIFDPDDELARERAPLLPGELADLRRKAETGGFNPRELEAARPLVPMAAESDKEVLEGLQKLHAESEGTLLSRDAHIEDLIRGSGAKPRRRRKKPEPEAAPEPAPPPAPPEPEVTEPSEPEEKAARRRDPKAAAELVKKARAARRAGRAKVAERLFHQALAQDNRSGAALIGLSDLYFDRSAHQKAVHFAEKAVAAVPRRASYRIKLGDAYFKILRYPDARRAYERAKQLGAKEADQRLEKLRSKLGK
jgi:serine/threonine protein kinase